MGAITGNFGSSVPQTSNSQNNDISGTGGTSSSTAANSGGSVQSQTVPAAQQTASPVNPETVKKGTQKHAREQGSMQMLSAQITNQNLQASIPASKPRLSTPEVVSSAVIQSEKNRFDKEITAQAKKIEDMEKQLSQEPATATDVWKKPGLEKELPAEKKKLEDLKAQAEQFKALPPDKQLVEATKQFLKTAGPKDRDLAVTILSNMKKQMGGGAEWKEFYHQNFDKIYDFLGPFGLREIEGPGMDNFQQDNFDQAVKNWQHRKDPGRTDADNRLMPTQAERDAQNRVSTTSRGPEDEGIPYQGGSVDERRKARADREEDKKNQATMARIQNVEEAGPFSLLGRIVGRAAGGDEEVEDTLAALGAIADSTIPHMVGETPDYTAPNRASEVNVGDPPERATAKETQPDAVKVNNSSGPPPNIHNEAAYAETQNAPQKNTSEAAYAKTQQPETVQSNSGTKSPNPPASSGGAKVNIDEVDSNYNTLKPKNYSPGRPITIETPNGSKDMTVGDYRNQVREARSWVTEQMRAGRGSHDPQALNREAAEKFGLDRGWNSIENPFVY